MATSRLAYITFLDSGGNVDNTLPGIPGVPDNSLPGLPGLPIVWPPQRPDRPNNDLPGYPGFPVNLPVFPFDPTLPNNDLPDNPSVGGGPILHPGAKFILKYMACHGFILVPDNDLPLTPQPK